MQKIKKLLLIAFIFSFFIGNLVFAKEAGISSMLSEFLVKIIQALSRFWIVPAIIAGKLMTNDFVYWSLFHLDKYLWLVWNIIKNFAYFTLGFLFLFLILKSFFKWEPTSVMKDSLPKIVIASFLISATWFLMWALIDLSNIATAAVWSFTSKFYEETASSQTISLPKNLKLNLDVNDKKSIVDYSSGKQEIKLNSEDWKWIMPKYNDFSGPLLYMGYWIMNLQNYNLVSQDSISLKSVGFDFLLKAILIIMFVVPIILLAVVNIMRIFWIWLWVMFSPFIVLDAVFGWPLSKRKHFKLWNMLWLIFQPVAVIGCLSLAFILIVSIGSIFNGDKESQEFQCEDKTWVCIEKIGLRCEEDNNCSLSQWTWGSLGTMKIKGNIIENTWDKVWWGIGYIIQALFVCFLVWWLIKAGFKTTEITSSVTSWVFNFVWGTVKATPILPWKQSLGSVELWARNIKQATSRRLQSQDREKITSSVEKMFGVDSLSRSDLKEWVANPNPRAGWKALFENVSEVLADGRAKSFDGSPAIKDTLLWWLVEQNGVNLLKKEGILNSEEAEEIKNKNNVQTLERNLKNNDKFATFIKEAIQNPEMLTDIDIKTITKSTSPYDTWNLNSWKKKDDWSWVTPYDN